MAFMSKTGVGVIVVLITGLLAGGGLAAEMLQVVVPGQTARLSFQPLDASHLMVSVTDADGTPVRGLTAADFEIGQGIRKATILKVEPLETSEEIPLNVVLVVDNSFSMLERQAVEPMLSALDGFFRSVRPIDNIHAVVFSKGAPVVITDRTLHTLHFQSGNPAALRDFFRQAFEQGLTGKTYLNEAILAGLDRIRQMPADAQKFMVVFSDGEDLNSDYGTDAIEVEAFGIKNFEVYCIDYMPRDKTDEFLSAFAGEHGGRIWKAKSAEELQPIFEEFTSALRFRYVVTYELSEPLVLQPAEMNFEMLTTLAGKPLANRIYFQAGSSAVPSKYVRFTDPSQTEGFEEGAQTSALDNYLNLLNIAGRRLRQNPAARVEIRGGVSDAAAEKVNPELALQRAAAVKEYLSEIWRIEAHRITAAAEEAPAADAAAEPGARLENQYAELRYSPEALQKQLGNGFVAEAGRARELVIDTRIFTGAEAVDWTLTLFGDDRQLHALSGSGDIHPQYRIALQDLPLDELAALGALEARIRVKNRAGEVQEASSNLCHIRLAKREVIHALALPPGGMLALEPESLTIEEVTLIDSSPLLNYIFFETAKSDIAERYVKLAGAAAETFDETALKGTLEKYYNVLNIIGRRLRLNPTAAIRLVGCNSHQGEERGRTDLSRSRADAVKAYLQYVWGIEPSRMVVEARNLPAVASTGGVAEGREENQRVEIYSDQEAVLDTVKSTYVEAVSDTAHLRIVPAIVSSDELAEWRLELSGDGQVLESLSGAGGLAPVYSLALKDIGLLTLGAFREIVATLAVEDRLGQTFSARDASSVRFVRREQRVAQKEGYRVIEKYALILFDFDRTDIKERNRTVLDRIVGRIGEIPGGRVRIAGHTDTIGKEAYNVSLSQRRALAAYQQMRAAGVGESVEMTHEGAGPSNPLYDNGLPEGRALNRTVTVTLEYEQE